MMFVEQFEAVVRLTDNSIVNLGPYDTYEECHDDAIRLAAKSLPTETVIGFMINKSFINKAVMGG